MSIFNGSDISKLYVGDTQIKSAYVGDTKIYSAKKKWVPMTWNGLSSFHANQIWTDGTDVYRTAQSGDSYILNKNTHTWSSITWNGSLPSSARYAYQFWTDGTDTYYTAYRGPSIKLNKNTNMWENYSWNDPDAGITFDANYCWFDTDKIVTPSQTIRYFNFNGATDNLFNSSSRFSMRLDIPTHIWYDFTWDGEGVPKYSGNNIWTDGENYYCTVYNMNFILDASTRTWYKKDDWPTMENGYQVWTDGENAYYSGYIMVDRVRVHANLIYDKESDTWSDKDWSVDGGFVPDSGNAIWTDGENYYYSDGDSQYVLE